MEDAKRAQALAWPVSRFMRRRQCSPKAPTVPPSTSSISARARCRQPLLSRKDRSSTLVSRITFCLEARVLKLVVRVGNGATSGDDVGSICGVKRCDLCLRALGLRVGAMIRNDAVYATEGELGAKAVHESCECSPAVRTRARASARGRASARARASGRASAIARGIARASAGASARASAIARGNARGSV
eukprot:5327932-Pleurochrysis_carterae.AAC.3